MTWGEWNAARQLLMEDHLGKYVRQKGHAEEDAFKQTANRLGREKHGPR